MGGQICVGVRRSDGREYWTERWTNPQQWYITEPTFQTEGERLEVYLSDKTFAREDGPKLLDAPLLHPEYGYILVDFKTKQIFSRNKYTHYGRLIVMDSHDLEHVQAMQDLGWIREVKRYVFHDDRKDDEEIMQASTFEGLVSQLKDGRGMFEVWWEGILKVVSHEGEDHPYEEALTWARENGWHMKTMKTPPPLS